MNKWVNTKSEKQFMFPITIFSFAKYEGMAIKCNSLKAGKIEINEP
jgi:hypothetical protein